MSACAACLRRSWLLGELAGPLERCAGDRARLLGALALDAQELLAALGGRRRGELGRRLVELDPAAHGAHTGADAVCRHDARYPRPLAARDAPRLLFVRGAARLHELAATPVVAILGSSEPSDYGNEIAAGLARGLAAAGVTVASTLAGGIPSAAQAGVRELGHGAIAVLADGPGARVPARARSLHADLLRRGCVACELPGELRGRRFGAIAAERTLVALACAVVLVESRAPASELAAAREARARGKVLAAVPGRAGSPLAAGPHALLRDDAALVCGPRDVLELLPGTAVCVSPDRAAGLTPRLRALLDHVAAGRDTAGALCAELGGDPDEVLLGLSELELLGLLGRGAGGRYVPRAVPGP